MVSCAKKIIEGLSRDPKALATLLLSENFVSMETFVNTIELNETHLDKARRLYTVLLMKVQEYPRVYHDFVQILRDDMLYEDLCKSLCDEYHQQQGTLLERCLLH